MRWHVPTAKVARNKRGKSSGLTVFNNSDSIKPRRRHQETEIYSKLFYKDRILPEVRKRLDSLGESHGPMITIIRDVTMEMYEKEDAETKAAVALKIVEAKCVDVDGEDVSSGLQRTPAQYQQ